MNIPTWKVDDENLTDFVELVDEMFDVDFDPENEDEYNDRLDYLQNHRLLDVLHDLRAARQYIASLGEATNG